MPQPANRRSALALRSLEAGVSLHELAVLLLQACDEVAVEGDGTPGNDAACALIAARIGFASPVDTMSRTTWRQLVALIEDGGAGALQVRPDARH